MRQETEVKTFQMCEEYTKHFIDQVENLQVWETALFIGMLRQLFMTELMDETRFVVRKEVYKSKNYIRYQLIVSIEP